MILRFGKKDNEIVFWTLIKGLPKVSPIKTSNFFIPEWFKKMPLYPSGHNLIPNVNKGSVKGCPGIMDFFKLGFVVPLWCDVYMEITNDTAKINTSDSRYIFSGHPNIQMKNYLPSFAKESTKIIIKANCPWHVKTPKGISLLQLPMLYHYNEHFTTAPGIVDSDRYYTLNQQLMMHKVENVTLKKGTPLCMYIPIRRESFKHVVREATEFDMKMHEENITRNHATFTGGYKQRQRNENYET